MSNKSYIGATTNYKYRINQHKKALASGKHHSVKLQRAYDLYGKDSFAFRVIDSGDSGELKSTELEQFWIDHFNSYYDGYNARKDATWIPAKEKNGMFGKKPKFRPVPKKAVVAYNIQSGEVFEYPSVIDAIKFFGHPGLCSCLTKPKLHKSFKNHLFFYSKDFSLQSLKEKFIHFNTNHSIGRKRSKEECEAISKGRKGIKFSDSHIQNMRLCRLGKKTKGFTVVRNDGKRYISINEAAIDNQVNNKRLASYIRKEKPINGYTFSFSTNMEN